MPTSVKTILLGGLFFSSSILTAAETPPDKTVPAATVNATVPYTGPWRWFDEARFGVFIHYGPQSAEFNKLYQEWPKQTVAPDYEFSKYGQPTKYGKYQDLMAASFNPDKFDAKKIVHQVQSVGARYLIFTSVHHDTYCLWDTKTSEHKVTNSKSRRDICAELYAACQEAKLPLFWYFGPARDDWCVLDGKDIPGLKPEYQVEVKPGEKIDPARHVAQIMKLRGALVRELMEKFPKIAGFWWDMGPPAEMQNWQWYAKEYNRPDIVMNGQMYNNSMVASGEGGANLNVKRDCRKEAALSPGNGRWFWTSPNNSDFAVRPGHNPLANTVKELVYYAGRDVNCVLNIAPDPSGEYEPNVVQGMEIFGAWMKKHGHTIYGTRGGPFFVNTSGCGWIKMEGGGLQNGMGNYDTVLDAKGRPGTEVTSTCKGNTIFLHVLNWNNRDTLPLPPIPAKIIKHEVLTGGTATVEQTDAGVKVSVPKDQRDAVDTIISLTLDREAFSVQPVFGLKE